MSLKFTVLGDCISEDDPDFGEPLTPITATHFQGIIDIGPNDVESNEQIKIVIGPGLWRVHFKWLSEVDLTIPASPDYVFNHSLMVNWEDAGLLIDSTSESDVEPGGKLITYEETPDHVFHPAPGIAFHRGIELGAGNVGCFANPSSPNFPGFTVFRLLNYSFFGATLPMLPISAVQITCDRIGDFP